MAKKRDIVATLVDKGRKKEEEEEEKKQAERERIIINTSSPQLSSNPSLMTKPSQQKSRESVILPTAKTSAQLSTKAQTQSSLPPQNDKKFLQYSVENRNYQHPETQSGTDYNALHEAWAKKTAAQQAIEETKKNGSNVTWNQALGRAANRAAQGYVDFALGLEQNLSNKLGLTEHAANAKKKQTELLSQLQNTELGRQNAELSRRNAQLAEGEREYNQARLNYLTNTIRNSPDFSVYSKYDPNKGNDRDFDSNYEYINGSYRLGDNFADALSLAMSSRVNSQAMGGNLDPANFLTSEEKGVYNYLYNKEGKQQADDYYNALLPTLNARVTQEVKGAFGNLAASSAPMGAALTAAAVPLKFAGDIYATGNTMNQILTGNPSGQYSTLYSDIAEGIRGAISQKLIDNGHPVWNFLYQTGNSMLDSTARAATAGLLGGGTISKQASLLPMAMGVYQQQFRDAVNNGKSEEEAKYLGVIAAGAEWLTEMVELDNLFGILTDPPKNTKAAIANALKQAAVEGTEELESNIINSIGDIAVLGDRSEWSKTIAEYEKQNYSHDEAIRKAFIDKAVEAGLDYLGGFISGGAGPVGGIAAETAVKTGLDLSIKGAEKRQNSNNAKYQEQVKALADKAKAKADAAQQQVKEAEKLSTEEWEKTLDQSEEKKQKRAFVRQTAEGKNVSEDDIRTLEALSDNTSATLGFTTIARKEGETGIRNGQITKNADGTETILVNTESKEALKFILGHEFDHAIEGTKEYDDVRTAAGVWLKSRGININNLIDSRIKLYAENGVTLDRDDAYKEVVADFVGDVLIADQDQINALVTTHHDLVQRLWNWTNERLARKFGTYDQWEKTLLNKAREKFGRALYQDSRRNAGQKVVLPTDSQNAPAAPAADTTAPTTVPSTNTTAPTTQTTQATQATTDAEYNAEVEKVIDDFIANRIDLDEYNRRIDALEDKYGYPVSMLSRGGERQAPTVQTAQPVETAEQAVPRPGVMPTAGQIETANRQLTPYQKEKAELDRQLREEEIDEGEYDEKLGELDEKYNMDVESALQSDIEEYEGSEDKYSYNTSLEDNITEREAEPMAKSPDGETLTEELRGGTVSKYSITSWNNTDKAAVKKSLVDAGYSETEADRYIENVNSIAAIIAADPDRLDYDAATNQVYLKPNQDYVVTLDASTLCAKRLIYQGTLNKIMHKLGNRVLMPEDLIELSNMMAENNYQTPCGICYVESRRRHLSRFASEWLNNYKGSYKPTLDQLTTTDGLEELRKNHNDVYTAFIKAMNAKGSANPKVVQLRTDYRGDLNRLTPAQIKKILNIGGLRIQSFSDFETPHLIDTMQAVLDMSAKKLTAQAYTKVPNFAWVFGDTGIKINLSLIGDIDENGNLTFSSVEGMDFDEAMKLRNRYSKNVGTILVGKNDAHIIAAMGDDRIDFIIPFHKSGWSQKEIELMKSLLGFEDYTEYQSERRVVGRYKNGKYMTESIEDQYYPIDYWDYNLSGQENAEKYLQMCAEDGRLPKFWNFLVDNGDGSFSLPQGNDKRSAAIRKGYWKTLIDFKMYDNDGNGAPQRAVTPNINMEEAERVLADYEGGANELPSASDEFIDKYVEHYNNTHGSAGSTQHSITPEEEEEVRDYVDKLPAKTKFSINAPVEKVETDDGRNLIAVHNVDTANLYKMLTKWGKIPSPSIAIIINGMTHDDYGENTVVFKKDAVDPKAHEGNRIYGGDAFTHTMSGINNIENKSAEEVATEIGNEQTANIKEFGSLDDVRNSLLSPKEKYRRFNWEAKRAKNQAEEKIRQITYGSFDEWYAEQTRNPVTRREFENADFDDLDNLYDWIEDITDKMASGEESSVRADSLVKDRLDNPDISNIERSFIEKNEKNIAKGISYIASAKKKKISANNIAEDVLRDIPIRGTDFNLMFNADANYYEAKSGRAIGADEIAGVVLSEDSVNFVEPKLVDALKDMGIPYEFYDGYDSEARMAAVNRIADSVPDARFSITPEENREYMRAAEAGDTETAQRMVDEAAKKAGYTIKAYHGTTNDFTKFSREEQGRNHNGYLEFGGGFYFTPNENEAREWVQRGRSGQSGKTEPKVMSVYLNPGRIIEADDPIDAADMLIDMGVYKADAYFITNRTYRFIDYLAEEKGFSNAEIQKTLESLGYSAIESTYKRGTSGQYVVFDPNQIKSADPITYDDDGNIIPLSERFNPENEDIRYSISPERKAQHLEVTGAMKGRQAQLKGEEKGRQAREEAEAIAADTIANAKETGKAIVEVAKDKAKEKGGRIVDRSKEKADRITRNAQVGSKMYQRQAVRSAEEEAKEIVAEARAAAQGILSNAKESGKAYEALGRDKAKAAEKKAYERGTERAEKKYTKMVKDFEAKQKVLEDRKNEHIDLWNRVKSTVYKPIESPDDAMDLYGALKLARKNLNHTTARSGLTDRENAYVGRLLRGEEVAERLFEVPDIRYLKVLSVATSLYNYSQLGKILSDYRSHQRAVKNAVAAQALGPNFMQMRDIPTGWFGQLQTPERMMEYIADKDYDTADLLKQLYVRPIAEANADEVRLKDEVRNRVRKMNIDTTVRKGNKVSEDYAVQYLGEMWSNAEDLREKTAEWEKKHNQRLTKLQGTGNTLLTAEQQEKLKTEQNRTPPQRDGMTLEEIEKAIADFKAENPNLDYNRIEGEIIPRFREIYNALFEMMNQVRVANGYEPVDYRKGYFPHYRRDDVSPLIRFAKSMGIDFDTKLLPTTIQGLTQEFKPGINWFGNALKRKGTETDYGVTEGIDRYIEGVSKVIYRTNAIQNMRALANTIRRLSDSDWQKKIDQIYSDRSMSDDEKYEKIENDFRNQFREEDPKAQRTQLGNFVTLLDEYTNTYAGKATYFDRGVRNLAQNRATKGLFKLINPLVNLPRVMTTKYGANTVSINPGSWLTNFAPIFEAAAEINPYYVAKALVGMKDQMIRADEFRDASNFITARFGSDTLVKPDKRSERIVNTLAQPMEWIDGITSYVVTRSRYEENMGRGMSSEAALAEADEFAGRLMADRGAGRLPLAMQHKNPIAKLFTQFQVENLNSLFHNTHDVMYNLEKKYKDDESRGKALKILAQYAAFAGRKAILLWLVNELYEALVGRRFMPDPIDWANEYVGDTTGKQTPNLINTGIEQGLYNITGGKLGHDTADDWYVKSDPKNALKNLGKNVLEEAPMVGSFLGGGRFPVQSVYKDISKLPKGVDMLFDDNDKNTQEAIANIVKGLSGPLTYLILPGGGTAVKRIVQAAEQYAQGGSYDESGKLRYPLYTDNPLETVGNVGKIALFGGTSTDAGQKWVDSGFNTFSKAATAAYQSLIALDVPTRKAYDIVNKYRDVEKTEDETQAYERRQYIRNLDISGKAKTAMYETLVLGENNKARDVLDTLDIMGADMNEAVNLMFDIADINRTNYTPVNSKSQDIRDAICNSNLSGDDKLLVYQNYGVSSDRERAVLDKVSQIDDDDELVNTMNAIKSAKKTDTESESSLQRKALNESNLSGEGKLIIYTDYMLTSSSQKEIDCLNSVAGRCDDGELVKTAMALKESGKAVDDTKALLESRLPADVKETLYNTLVSDTKDEKIASLKKAGLSFDEYLKVANKYSEIGGDDDAKAGVKATDFSMWLDKQGYSGNKKEAIQDAFGYYNMSRAKATGYEKLTASGMKPDEARDLADQLSGMGDAKDYQKAAVIASNKQLDEKEKLAALRYVYSDTENSTYSKAYVANMYDIKLDDYFAVVQKCLDIDADPKYSEYKSNERIAAAIKSFSNLTNKQKAAIWQCYNISWAAKNNPFDSSVGAYVKSLYYESDGKTRKETMPGGLSYGKSTSTTTLPTESQIESGRNASRSLSSRFGG